MSLGSFAQPRLAKPKHNTFTRNVFFAGLSTSACFFEGDKKALFEAVLNWHANDYARPIWLVHVHTNPRRQRRWDLLRLAKRGIKVRHADLPGGSQRRRPQFVVRKDVHEEIDALRLRQVSGSRQETRRSAPSRGNHAQES